MNTLYLFIDESGNFDFTESGTDHFILTILCTSEPEVVQIPLAMIHDDIKNKTNPASPHQDISFLILYFLHYILLQIHEEFLVFPMREEEWS